MPCLWVTLLSLAMDNNRDSLQDLKDSFNFSSLILATAEGLLGSLLIITMPSTSETQLQLVN